MDAPLKPIWDKINKGTNAEKMARLPNFPRMVDIELTNCCNLKCRMCPTGCGTSSRKQGFMAMNTLTQILLECSKRYTPVRLIRWGEPMLHPECFRMIRLIKSFGIKCHMNTNGTMVDADAVTSMIDSGLDSIKFSFQGVTGEEYTAMRQGGDYVQLCGWIKYLFIERNRRRKRHPHIQVGTTCASEDGVAADAFRKSMGKVCDYITVGKTQNIINPEATETTPQCPEVFDRLSVNWDGTVTACCRDYDNLLLLGHIQHKKLEDMWLGKPMMHIRKMLLSNQHNKLPVCKGCFL